MNNEILRKNKRIEKWGGGVSLNLRVGVIFTRLSQLILFIPINWLTINKKINMRYDPLNSGMKNQ
jgi:hypothetical protein